MLRQSGRFGVISSSRTSVEIGSTSTSGVPGTSSSASTMIRLWSVPMATSSSARIMPSEATPRSFARLSRVPSGITAPGWATATVCPSATLGAPQTICAVSPSPTATMQTVRRSASGWRSAESTRPTMKYSSAVTPWAWMRSTAVPVMSRRSASLNVSSRGSQKSVSQKRGSSISRQLRVREAAPLVVSSPPWLSSELLQEPQVVLEEHPQVGHAVLEEGDALDAHAPREALVALGVIARVAHVGVQVGVDHAGAEDLDPRRPLAQRAPRAVAQEALAAVEAAHVELHAGLGEREVVRPQAHLALVAEDRPREGEQRPLEVAEREVVVHREALDLVELRRVRGVVVGPVDAARHHDVERRPLHLHGAHLHR